MSKKHCILTILLSTLTGVVGGAVSSHFFVGVPAFAKESAEQVKTITAEQFRLVNKDGQTIAVLGNGSDADAGQLVFLQNGIPRAGFGVSKDGGVLLRATDDKQNTQFGLTVDSKGEVMLHLKSKNGNREIVMDVREEGEATILLGNGRGAGIKVSVDSKDEAKIDIRKNNQQASILSIPSGEKSGLVLSDAYQKVLWTAP